MAKRESVTAIIPIRNGAKYLPDFIPNILHTCDEQDEILFIEDHSTDETREILKTYSSRFHNIKVIHAEKEGLVNALNQGIKEASHDWLARFDCDDKYVGTRIDLQTALIDKNVVCIFSDYRIRGSEGQDLGLIPSQVNLVCLAKILLSLLHHALERQAWERLRRGSCLCHHRRDR
jgi:glycosyltransferase involved in cell wall biosynthesis